jgi:hypothetical protein
MTFYLGNYGNIRLRRGTDPVLGSISSVIEIDDVSTVLNRVGFESGYENLLTGDRVDLLYLPVTGLSIKYKIHLAALFTSMKLEV